MSGRPLVESLEGRRLLSTMTVNFNAPGNALNKAGLGSLFGISTTGGGISKALTDGSQLTVSVAMDKPTDVGGNPAGLTSVAPLVSGTRTKLIARYADMLNGFPYTWVSLDDWDAKVTFATNLIKNNATYKQSLLCIAVFNEPDANFGGAFLTDPAIAGAGNGEYQRINWLWAHTANLIRSIDPTLPLMGPNFLFYNPHNVAGEDAVMRNYLSYAKSTNTLPDMVGWHPLLTYDAADVRKSVVKYRQAEDDLGVSDRPIVMEEYGFNNDSFAGVPSSMLPFWAEMERSGVAYAAAGVYDNGGTLGNTIRSYQESNPQLNAGYFMHNWYMNLSGQYVPTSAGETRYTGAYDGIATWDANAQTGTILLAGPEDRATLALQGIAAKLGPKVRVQVEVANWTTTTNEFVGSTNTPNPKLMRGGDAINAPYTLYDRVLTPDVSGNLNVPLHIQAPDGYRILLSRAPTSGNATATYEAEAAARVNATATVNANASGGTLVSGIAASDSSVTFTVDAAANGLYELAVDYAAASAGSLTHALTVNGITQGIVTYVRTPGTTVGTVRRYVQLKAGANALRLTKGTGVVDLDRIALTPINVSGSGVIKYEAEHALINRAAVRSGASGGAIASNAAFVAGSEPGSITFTVTVPAAGDYTLLAGYANGGASTASHLVSVNGALNTLNYAPTGGSLIAGEGLADRSVTLVRGVNTLVFNKGTGTVDLDFVAIVPRAAPVAKYEAEQATRTHVVTYASGGSGALLSGTGYVGGIDFADSAVSFLVNVPAAGLYDMTVRYAANLGAATQGVSVNYQSQGEIALPASSGWSQTDLRTASKLVALQAGPNVITLSKGTNFAELDFITLAQDAHRYDAAGATLNSVNRGVFPKSYTFTYPNFVGGINDVGDSILFTVDVPIAGNYTLAIGYGSTGTATHALTVNDAANGTVIYPATSGYLGGLGPAGRGLATRAIALVAGQNTIKIEKAIGFAEIQFATLAYAPAAPATPATPALSAASDSGVSSSDRLTNAILPTITGTAAPGAAITLRLNSAAAGSGVADATGNFSIVLTTPLNEGVNTVTVLANNAGGASAASGSLVLTLDTTAPMLADPQFVYQTGLGIVVTANETLDASYIGTAPVLVNRDGGATPTLVRISSSGSEVRYGFSTTPINANYDVTAGVGVVRDLAGNASTSASTTTPFFVLAGDANRDRAVNFDDLLVLAVSYGQSGRTFSQGDFNGNASVDFDDLLILAVNYNALLAAPPEALAVRATPTRRRVIDI